MMGICTVVAFRQRRITMPTFQKIEAICSTTIRRARMGAASARFVKNMLLALPVLLFAFEAIAAGCSGLREYFGAEDEERVDFVDSVRINGQIWGAYASIRETRDFFGEKDAKVTVTNEEIECPAVLETGVEAYRYVMIGVTIQYPDKSLFFTTSDNGENTDYTNLMKDDAILEQEHGVGILWDLKKFRDTLVVAGHDIRPDLTLAEFRKMFPRSARENFNSYMSPDGVLYEGVNERYVVGVSGAATTETCLFYGLEFVFSNGKLTELALRSYEDYGSCIGC
jgi:hypothetical protein